MRGLFTEDKHRRVKNMSLPRVQFDSTFIEEAVFLKARLLGETDSSVKSFHQQREGIYQRPLESREPAFERLYEDFFRKMGLRMTFEEVLSEFPLVLDPAILIFVKRVWGKKEEGSELYVQDAFKTVFIGLQVTRIWDVDFLKTFLRHELMHIADMLDAGFQYLPNIPLGGRSELEDNLIRERFSLLWDMFVDARLRQKGFKTVTSLEKQRMNFDKIFLFWNEETKQRLFARLTSGQHQTHSQLLDLARDERHASLLGEGGLRCPLCEFPCYEQANHLAGEFLSVVKEIKKDFPQWEVSMGLCPQCYELYRTKVGGVQKISKFEEIKS